MAVIRDKAIRADAMVFMEVLRVWKPTSSALHPMTRRGRKKFEDVTGS